MAVKIGHASGDERRGASGGLAGDQTGGEVCIRDWYSSPWNVLLRPKSSEIAEASAKACEEACANPHIGYDQNERNTLYSCAKGVDFRLGSIKEDCECDCSSLMHVCAIAGGAALGFEYNCFWTGNMAEGFIRSGDYEKLTEEKYLSSDAYLKRGDILLNTRSHTAMVLSDGEMVKSGDCPPEKPGEETVMNTPLPLLKCGSSGQAVWAMQLLLCLRGYDVGTVDGDFGPNTLRGLRLFQSLSGLEADGECGALSWQALIAGGE